VNLLAPVVCALVATGAQPFVIGFLRRGAVLDVPGHRSSHTTPTPRGGGLAVGLGLLAGLSVVALSTWFPLAVALIVFAAVGLAEDLYGISVGVRLLLQLGTGAVVGALLAHGNWLVVVALAVWITGFANAFNFMDGVNGISGAHAVLGGLAFAAIGSLSRDPTLVVAALVVAAGGLAFLPWNAVRAKVFLGDVGSYGLGAFLAVLAAHTLLRGLPVEAVLGPFALYLADTSTTLVRRMRRGEPFLQPHREHTYQRLGDLGWSHTAVTAATTGVSAAVAALGLVSIGGSPAQRAAADAVALALLVVYLAAPTLLQRQASLVLGGRRAW
jgi:UDP-GlcNAc:undecaprenyl-phosphate/decaprenyl-phosphate GlcNAc-1-phosphate transferase